MWLLQAVTGWKWLEALIHCNSGTLCGAEFVPQAKSSLEPMHPGLSA